MSVSTHVLNAVTGRPAVGMTVELALRTADGWQPLGQHRTDDDGRISDLAGDCAAGTYRLLFDTGGYLGGETLYPEVTITFFIRDGATHHHVPLLLSPYAYSTYRGS